MGKNVPSTAASVKLTSRITLVISALTAGGAERVLSIMANYWVAHGVEVTLITLADASQPPFYNLNPDICLIPLGVAKESATSTKAILNNLMRVRMLRRAIKQSHPQVVISFITPTNVLVSLAAVGLKIQVILSERTEPTMEYPGRMWDILRSVTYSFADHVVLVSEYSRNYFPKSVRKNAVVIPNPVISPSKNPPGDAGLSKPAIVAMGRFEQQKGFDLLLEAFAEVNEKHPEWSLTILGDGKLRSTLESLRNDLGLNSKVHMPGIVKNSYDYLRQADLFVMSSRYEGFPNALCEAMASGTAVISFDCKTGPGEIINDDEDGILVPPEDVDALANAMSRIMGDETKRKHLESEAPKLIERFGLEKVMGMWNDVIN